MYNRLLYFIGYCILKWNNYYTRDWGFDSQGFSEIFFILSGSGSLYPGEEFFSGATVRFWSWMKSWLPWYLPSYQWWCENFIVKVHQLSMSIADDWVREIYQFTILEAILLIITIFRIIYIIKLCYIIFHYII